MLWRCLSCPAGDTWDKRNKGATSDFLLRALGLGAHRPPGAQSWIVSILPSLETGKQRKEKCKSSQGGFFFFLKREKENESTSDIWSHNTLKSISLPLIFTVSSVAPVKWESSSISPYANCGSLPPPCAILPNCLGALTPPQHTHTHTHTHHTRACVSLPAGRGTVGLVKRRATGTGPWNPGIRAG